MSGNLQYVVQLRDPEGIFDSGFVFISVLAISRGETTNNANKNREGLEYVRVLQNLQKQPRRIQKGHLHWLVGGRDDSHMNHMIAGPMRRDLVSVNIPTRDSSWTMVNPMPHPKNHYQLFFFLKTIPNIPKSIIIGYGSSGFPHYCVTGCSSSSQTNCLAPGTITPLINMRVSQVANIVLASNLQSIVIYNDPFPNIRWMEEIQHQVIGGLSHYLFVIISRLPPIIFIFLPSHQKKHGKKIETNSTQFDSINPW